jgi:predicted nucleotidyltransferase
MTPVETRINAILGATPGIAAVLRFGSAVRGQLRPESDIDVAALFAHATVPSLEERRRVQQRLEEAVQRDVDLVVLNDVPTILARQALKYGILIACPNPRLYHKFVIRCVAWVRDAGNAARDFWGARAKRVAFRRVGAGYAEDVRFSQYRYDDRKRSPDVLKAILVHRLTDLETLYSEILALLPPSLSDQPVD